MNSARKTINSRALRLLVDCAIQPRAPLLELADCRLISSNADVASKMPEVQGLVVRSGIKVDEGLLDLLPNLSFIASPISGSDHLDLTAIRARAINVHCAPGCNANAVRDYVLHMLAASGHLRPLLAGEARLGIVGYGHVGRALASLCAHLRIGYLVFDPLVAVPKKVAAGSMVELAANCSVISLHCNLHHDAPHSSLGIVNAELLAQLSAPQLILSVARGAVVDERAVQRRCLEPQAPLVIADTWRAEPECRQDYFACLWALTPHIAGHSADAYASGMRIILAKLTEHFDLAAPNLPTPAPTAEPLDIGNPELIQQRVLDHFPLLPWARRFQKQAEQTKRTDWLAWRKIFAERRDMLW